MAVCHCTPCARSLTVLRRCRQYMASCSSSANRDGTDCVSKPRRTHARHGLRVSSCVAAAWLSQLLMAARVPSLRGLRSSSYTRSLCLQHTFPGVRHAC